MDDVIVTPCARNEGRSTFVLATGSVDGDGEVAVGKGEVNEEENGSERDEDELLGVLQQLRVEVKVSRGQSLDSKEEKGSEEEIGQDSQHSSQDLLLHPDEYARRVSESFSQGVASAQDSPWAIAATQKQQERDEEAAERSLTTQTHNERFYSDVEGEEDEEEEEEEEEEEDTMDDEQDEQDEQRGEVSYGGGTGHSIYRNISIQGNMESNGTYVSSEEEEKDNTEEDKEQRG
ncbi:unnamed protein product, partial [Choristocarpus tenellus]